MSEQLRLVPNPVAESQPADAVPAASVVCEIEPNKHWQRALAITVLSGLIVSLYQFAQVLQKIQSWEVLYNPPTVGDILMALVAGLLAVAASLGLDVPALMRGFTKKP